MTLITGSEILEAIEAGEIEIDPLDEEGLRPVGYELRLGERAIVTRTAEIERLRERPEERLVAEIDVAHEGSVSIPAGGLGLVVTRELVRLSDRYAGHIGLQTDLGWKGGSLLSGLQVDPCFEGHLVLGIANLAPRPLHLAFEEPVATLELHRLGRPAGSASAASPGRRKLVPAIPRADADYLRTLEPISVPDLTRALIRLSDDVAALGRDVATLSRDVRLLWLPVGAALIATILSRAF